MATARAGCARRRRHRRAHSASPGALRGPRRTVSAPFVATQGRPTRRGGGDVRSSASAMARTEGTGGATARAQLQLTASALATKRQSSSNGHWNERTRSWTGRTRPYGGACATRTASGDDDSSLGLGFPCVFAFPCCLFPFPLAQVRMKNDTGCATRLLAARPTCQYRGRRAQTIRAGRFRGRKLAELGGTPVSRARGMHCCSQRVPCPHAVQPLHHCTFLVPLISLVCCCPLVGAQHGLPGSVHRARCSGNYDTYGSGKLGWNPAISSSARCYCAPRPGVQTGSRWVLNKGLRDSRFLL